MRDGTAVQRDFQALKQQLELHRSAGVVGVDVAKNKHFATILDPAGQTIQPPFSFANTRSGFDSLSDRIEEMTRRHLINHWVVGFEASGGYEKPLAGYLSDKGYDVVQVKSYAVKRHREMITGSVDKNDMKDCLSVAYLVQQGHIDYYQLKTVSEEDVSGLVLLNEHLKARRRQLKQKIKQNVLKYIFPELEGFLKNIESQFVTEVLTHFPTPHDIVKAGKLEFKKTLLPRLKMRRVAFFLDELYALAENSIGLKADRWSTKALELRTYIAELRVVLEQRSAVSQRLLHKLETNEAYQLITTIPGVGFETGSTLVAEIGDISRFGSDKQLISFAGLDLVNYQSGEYQGKPRISKRGRPLIRKAAYQAVNSAIMATRPNLFNRKYREIRAKQGDTRDIRKKAKTKLCAKLLRIVYAVLTKKEAFRDEAADQ